MEIYTEDQINQILKLYIQKRQKEKERYDKIKDTDEFKIKNRSRAKKHYEENKHVKQNMYQENKEFVKARNNYMYYKKKNRVEDYKERYPERYQMLIDANYLIIQKPAESTETSNSGSGSSS
jgi:hypothetical protein